MSTSKNPMIDEDGEVRELKGSDFKHARKASDAFPGSLQAKLGMLKAKSTSARRAHDDGVSTRGSIGLDQIVDVSVLEDNFDKLSSKYNQRYADAVKIASSKLALHASVVLEGKRDAYQLAHTYLNTLNMDLYKTIALHAVESATTVSASEHDTVLDLLGGSGLLVRPSHSKLERMRKSTLTEVVKIQSEMLENFKVLFTVASSGTLEGVDLGRTVLKDEMEKAGLARRLREIAEDIEMTAIPHESRI